MLSAFFKDRRPMLRIYENEGTPVRARIDLPLLVTDVQMCDLLSRPMRDDRTVSVNGRSLEIDLGPWEVLTMNID